MDYSLLLDFDRDLFFHINGGGSLFMDQFMQTLNCGLTWIPLYLVLV